MEMHRFGKRAPRLDYRTLRFASYVTKVPAPPPAYSALNRVYNNLATSSAPSLFPIDGNDTLGDCTIAALAHSITVYRAYIKQKRVMAAEAVVNLYKGLTGGPDTGLHELDVLNYWRKHAVQGDEILAYVSIDTKNHTHIQQAIQLFGGVYLGFRVQKNAVEDFKARKPWEAGPLTNDGHAVYAVGYDDTGVTVLTWGDTQAATWAWWDECVDEAYAILPPQAQNPEFAPGFDIQQLQADLAGVTN